MPQYRHVSTLQQLSLKAIGQLVISLSHPLVKKFNNMQDRSKIVNILDKYLDNINNLLVSNIPIYLYNEMAIQVLNAIKLLIEKTKKCYSPNSNISNFLIEMNVVVSLTEVVLNPYLKRLDFTEWPKIMRHVLYRNFRKLSGLEQINFGSWNLQNYNGNIIDNLKFMKNLHSLCLCFDCTDQIIQILSENCKLLKCLDVTCSRSVTDRSVEHLMKFSGLIELQLHQTSVTVNGLSELLLKMENLQDMGRCDEFGAILKTIQAKSNDLPQLNLRKIHARGLLTNDLRLLIQIFPHVECLQIFIFEPIDLTILTHLNHLKEVKLLACSFYRDYLKEFLEIRGANLLCLHLEHVEEITLNVLFDVSQFCPKLKSLVLYNCDISNDDNFEPNKFYYFKVQPFDQLERLFWMVDCATTHLEFILKHARNIKHIQLGSSTGFTHQTIVNILAVNRMQYLTELKILFSSDLNMNSVEMLLANCKQLKVLSELESWQGISIEELRDFKRFIEINNFDLDIRPTLSYY